MSDMKTIIILLGFSPLSILAQNPFTFLGQTKTVIDTQIGKPVACDQKDGTKEVWAYPFSKSGDYHIKYVSDTARAFTYKPKGDFAITDIPYTLREAKRQPEEGKLLVSETDKPKIFVEVKDDKVKKITFLR
jgi:hypothetical protein